MLKNLVLLKIKTTTFSVFNELKSKLTEKEARLKTYEEELNKWINGVNGFTEKITKMQNDVDSYEKEKNELNKIKERQNELNDSYKK